MVYADIDATGRPVTVRLSRGSGSDTLDQAAVEAVKGWRFTPARHGDQAVAVSVVIPIHFRLTGTVIADAN